MILLSTGQDSFIFSFENTLQSKCLFLSCLIALVKTYSTMLNRRGKNEQPYLASNLVDKAFSSSPLYMMLPVEFSWDVFICLRR